jgi:AcrR family transcriptional regulator
VEPLARRLGVTKGSFYWHFPSRDALLQAALERWELFEQEQVFGSLEDVPDPRVRLRQLFQMVAHEVQPHIIYSELLKALDHPMVRPVIDRVAAPARLSGCFVPPGRAQLHRCTASRAPGLCRLRRLPAAVAAAAATQAGPRGFRGLCRASDRDAHSQLNGRMAPCKCRMRLAGDLNAPTYVVVRLVSRDLGIFLTTL